MEKTPNLIHLDVSQNASAPSLCGALVHLADCEQKLQQLFAGLGVTDFYPELQQHRWGGLVGVRLVFMDGLGEIAAGAPPQNLHQVHAGGKPRAARWSSQESETGDTEQLGRGNLQTLGARKRQASIAPEVSSLWLKDRVSLLDLKQLLKTAKLEPLLQGTCFRIFQEVYREHPAADGPVTLPMQVAKRLVLYASAVALALDHLAPAGISCTEVPFSNAALQMMKNQECLPQTLQLLEGMPVLENANAASADLASLGILKTIVHQWGLRPAGHILSASVGLEGGGISPVWAQRISCAGVATLEADSGASTVSWELLLEPTALLTELRQGLVEWGASSWVTASVFNGKGQPVTLVKVTLPQKNHVPAQKWCFEEGFTQQIQMSQTSTSQMQKQQVVLPWGQGAKQEQVSVWEYRWLGDVVRVLPHEPDVTRLATKTGFTSEAVRSDIMNAWRRWHVDNEPAGGSQ